MNLPNNLLFKENIVFNNGIEKDNYFIKNVLLGKIITNEIYPIIYESDNIRSIENFNNIINNNSQINKDDLLLISIGVRDLYYCYGKKLLNNYQINILKKIIEYIPDDTFEIQGINFSPYPTKNFQYPKFIDYKFEEIINPYFLNFTVKNKIFKLCFVNKMQLSYHNFENIIDLNFIWDKKIIFNDITVEQFYKDCYKINFTGNLSETFSDLLNCDLYTNPLNDQTRGGKRFIFQSEQLAINLTELLKQCKINNNSIYDIFDAHNKDKKINKDIKICVIKDEKNLDKNDVYFDI